MVEIASGDIQTGIRYTVSNQLDGSGTVTYQGIDYVHGDSFVGQAADDTYTVSTTDIKVYQDDTAFDFNTSAAVEVEDEVSRYPEDFDFQTSASEERTDVNVRYPEDFDFQTSASEEEGISYYFPEYSVTDFTQDGKNLIPTQSKFYLTHQVTEITNLLGNELYNGVTFDRLKELETIHPEITVTELTANNISKIEIDGIIIFMRLI